MINTHATLLSSWVAILSPSAPHSPFTLPLTPLILTLSSHTLSHSPLTLTQFLLSLPPLFVTLLLLSSHTHAFSLLSLSPLRLLPPLSLSSFIPVW